MLPSTFFTPVLHWTSSSQWEQLRIEAAICHDTPQVLRESEDAYMFISDRGGLCYDENPVAER